MIGVESPRRELVVCAGVAALISALLVSVVPQGGDLAAHLYRTALVQHGNLVWDNLWFAGQYPLFSYSLVYYLAASVVGNWALGVSSIVLAVAVFASLALHEWGRPARWSVRSFAVLAAGQLFTGAYPFDAGLAMMLLTIWALQRGRVALAVCCTVLTFGFSPLAFVFLVVALVALFLRSRRVSRRVVVVALVLAAIAGFELGMLALFPSPHLVYPYGWWRLLAGLAVAGSGAALGFRERSARPLTILFLVWAGASVVAYLIPSPIGHNILRASTFVFPLMLLTAGLTRFRPRWLAIPAVAGAFVATVAPYLSMIPVRSSEAVATAAFWRPMLAFLAAHPARGFRVEVVPTSNHWEAYYVPRSGYALARGWYRQLDIADNPALYGPRLTAAGYRRWLRQEGIRYVLLPRAPLEAVDASREASLLRSGESGLRRVWSGRDGTAYELPHASPILTGPGRATITTFTSSRVAGHVARPGAYLLRVHYTPYWQITGGELCLAPAPGGMTQLELRRAGRFSLRALESPGRLVASLLDGDHHRCRGSPRA